MIDKIFNNESKETNSEFKIRKVEEKDMEQICDLHARCWKENFKWIIEQSHLDNFGRIQGNGEILLIDKIHLNILVMYMINDERLYEL